MVGSSLLQIKNTKCKHLSACEVSKSYVDPQPKLVLDLLIPDWGRVELTRTQYTVSQNQSCCEKPVWFFSDLQINKVTPVLELKDHLATKKLSEQILRWLAFYYFNWWDGLTLWNSLKELQWLETQNRLEVQSMIAWIKWNFSTFFLFWYGDANPGLLIQVLQEEGRLA